MKNDIFCPNEHCHAKGHVGKGNIIVHSKRDNRFYCKECKRTFSGRKGTLFYRRKLDEATIVLIVGLLSYGCPASAIEQAFRIDGRTVRSLESGAGEHCKRVHEHILIRVQSVESINLEAPLFTSNPRCLNPTL